MSKEDYEAAAGEGRRWVYHASESPDTFAEGVKMENVPQHLARQRFAAGEPTEFHPGQGVGQGTYVAGEAHEVDSYGHWMHAIAVPTSHLEVPPEAGDYRPTDVEYHLNRGAVGALLTRDVGVEHIVNMGRIRQSGYTGHEVHQINALHGGEHVPDEVLSERVKNKRRMAKERGWEF